MITNIVAAISCILWPARPVPITLDRNISLPAHKSVVITLPYNPRGARLPVPKQTHLYEARIAIVNDVLYISLQNRHNHSVYLHKGDVIGSLVIGQCANDREA